MTEHLTAQLYQLDFPEFLCEELEDLAVPLRQYDVFAAGLSRADWVALGHLALGKAQRIRAGAYDIGSDDQATNAAWLTDLEEIAEIIFREFQPGDGKI